MLVIKTDSIRSLGSLFLSRFFPFLFSFFFLVFFFGKTMWKHLRTCVRLATRLLATCAVGLGYLLSSSSDTQQVIEIQKEKKKDFFGKIVSPKCG